MLTENLTHIAACARPFDNLRPPPSGAEYARDNRTRADITFSTTDLSGAGNAGIVASDADTGKTPCPSLPQATGVAPVMPTTDTAPTDAPVAPAATEAPAALEPQVEAPVSTEAPVAIEDPAFTESPAATEMPVATDVPTAKTPCPSLPQPSLASSSSTEFSESGDSSSSAGKSPCPSLQTASMSSDGSVSAPCPSLKPRNRRQKTPLVAAATPWKY
ncbi:uncharacterized protein PITG_19141 [Phytophthora infestans T30-4]|uniref:Uncharacterized protein n=1 Tax=Phytophthora infestans (strain T30-4) TaxID=403677 RepID=D0NYX7_PHYIT|nr:uncharacterized protein PITG_19141 [Phytophthora infestans T30-4]EEY68760.1 conserved hypothetical protein [Phytophthora infestans T30-4]|eukprot:XP_002997452.1 conserved hypothetical protein [Phytophthora infestans T30-4]